MLFIHKEAWLTTIILVPLLLFVFTITMLTFFFTFRRKRIEFKHEKQLMQLTFTQTLLESQLEIQEQTFNYISQELHDNVGQILSLAKVQANIMSESQSGSGELLNGIKENIDKALADLRDVAKSLSSERIRSLGLYNAVMAETERITKSGIMLVTCLLQGQEREIDRQAKLILFRMVQEGLQNCIKHSGASRINMLFSYQTEGLEVTIQDDGRGFDLQESLQQKSGLGLQNMATRAALVGGAYHIESAPNKGTVITIKIPYESA